MVIESPVDEGWLVDVMLAENIGGILTEPHHPTLYGNGLLQAVETGLIGEEERVEHHKKLLEFLDFPSNPDEGLDAIISGMLNRETKQLLTLLLGDEHEEIQDLASKFRRFTGEWEPRRADHLLGGYIDSSLEPVANVASVDEPPIIRGSWPKSFYRSPFGRYAGQAIAAHGLAMAFQLPIQTSYTSIFGDYKADSEERGGRTPYIRARILEVLYENEKQHTGEELIDVDLARTLEISVKRLSFNTKALANSGVISSRPIDRQGPETVLAYNPGHFSEITDPKQIAIATALSKLGLSTNYELVPYVNGQFPGLSNKEIAREIYLMFKRSTAPEFATMKYYNSKIHNNRINELGQGIVEKLLQPVRAALNGESVLAPMQDLVLPYQSPSAPMELVRQTSYILDRWSDNNRRTDPRSNPTQARF